MNTVGVWAGPSQVDGTQVVGECVVWSAREGLVITPILNPHLSPHPNTPPTPGQGEVVGDEAKDKACGEVDVGKDMPRRQGSSTQYIHTQPFTRLHTAKVSPCGHYLVLAGQVKGGEGVLVWREWPLQTSTPAQVILEGHTVHHMDFNNEGDYLGVLSTTTTMEQGERKTRLVLSVWRWPDQSIRAAGRNKTGSQDSRQRPALVVETSLDQVKAEQVTRLSLGRGLPPGRVAVMLAVGEEVQVWRVQEGPLGPQLLCTTIGFGLLAPDSIYTMWCLNPDAYALGVGSGWVMVGVGGEVVARLGGGVAGPCHSGPVTDLHLRSSHLYTVGGDGWLRVWEAEMVEEAALKTTRSLREVEGWFEAGMKTSWLQLVRELPVHTGPGFPIALTFAPLSTSVWIIQTTTGVIYGVWAGEWTACVLHQGPSERVTAAALSPTATHHHPLLAATTHHHYLLVATLPQPCTEESLEQGQGEGGVQVVSTLARAEVNGVPSCVTWATCQVTREDDLVVIGLEDGSVNVFLLHLAPKTLEKRLTLIQVERPHECRIHHITTTREAQPKKRGRGGPPSILVTAADDCRLFIFRLIRGVKLTKLEPVGFHQMEAVPERISVQGAVVVVEHSDGLVCEIPVLPSSSGPSSGPGEQLPARAAPDSWLLQQPGPSPQMVWQGGQVVHHQVLQEVGHTCCPGDHRLSLLLTLTAPDGSSMIGVTAGGQLVHTHRKANASYSIRVSARLSEGVLCDPEEKTAGEEAKEAADCEVLPWPENQLCEGRDGEWHKCSAAEKRLAVVACVAEDGAWAAAWVAGGDLFVYRARGSSFPLPQCTERKIRLVSVRGVGGSSVGASLEQRAQKEAGDKRKAAMENRATLLQQKLSKLKWDFRKVTLRADEVEGGVVLLEEIPLHPSISTTLHRHTTDNMNKVVSGSEVELERLEVLLGKLRTLYSWNPMVSVPGVQFLSSSGKLLTAVDHSEEVFALLSRLAQICHGREVTDGAGGSTDTPQSFVVVKVQGLLAAWLRQIRSGSSGSNGDRSGGGSGLTSGEEGAAGEQENFLTPRPVLARKAASSEGDTSDEGEEHHSLAALETQVREVVERVGSAGRPGGSEHVAESAVDPGRQLVWRRTALHRLREHRAGEAARTCQLTAYKKEHTAAQEEGKKDREETSEGEKGASEDAGLEDEVVVPPPSATREDVETHLWTLLGKVEEEAQKTREMVKQVAAAQDDLLETINQYQKEWGHFPLSLLRMAHHLHIQVTDDLVHEFYCDLLDLDESGEVGSAEESRRKDTGDRGSSQRASSSPRRQGGSECGVGRCSPPATAKDHHKQRRHEGRREGEGAAVPPLSLAGSPRQGRPKGRIPKTTTTTRAPRTSRAATTPTPSARSPTTKSRRSGGQGRRSVRDSTPRPPPAPRPHLTLEQVQQIQRSRTYLLTSLTQVPEPIQQEAQKVEELLEACQSRVVEERGRLAWAVLRVGQMVRAMSILVNYRDTEKRLRLALRERIMEQQAIKEKALGLRHKITGYEGELQCLAGLEEEVDRAFTHLVTDNAQFEVQLTHYYESRAAPGLPHHRPQSASSSSSSERGGGRGEGEGGGGGASSDSGDSDSGLGTDEARTDGGLGGGGGAGGGIRPPGCDPAVFSLVTVLRELRWRISTAVERGRREKAAEERRHTAVMRRLHRAAYASHTALTSLNTLQSDREEHLGAIPCVVWLRQSQTVGDISLLTRLPVPNTDLDSLMAVKWHGGQDISASTGAPPPPPVDDGMLLTKKYLDNLNERVVQAKVAQELAERRHREGRAERRALAQQVEQLREELTHLKHCYQVTKECKLGSGAEVDLLDIENRITSSLDLRWPSKVASQMARHDCTMMQLQTNTAGQTRELRALQREEAALAAHILALRQERDHLHHHLKQTTSQKRSASRAVRGVGGADEVRQLRTSVARQDDTIAALRLEITSLRDKTGTVTLPGLPPPPRPVPSPSTPPHSTSTWTEEHHSTRTTGGNRDSLPQTFRQGECSARDSSDGAATVESSDENADISSSDA